MRNRRCIHRFLHLYQQLESGEYFLSERKKEAKKWEEKQEKQAEKTDETNGKERPRLSLRRSL